MAKEIKREAMEQDKREENSEAAFEEAALGDASLEEASVPPVEDVEKGEKGSVNPTEITDEGEISDQEGQVAKGGTSGRLIGSGLVASAFVVLLLGTAALVFYSIAALMRADWIMLAVGIVAIGLLLWLMSRLVRVAANQNKIT